jgi:hypothetical protein
VTRRSDVTNQSTELTARKKGVGLLAAAAAAATAAILSSTLRVEAGIFLSAEIIADTRNR